MIRNPSLIVGVAVPILLAIAAWGLDRLLHLPWPCLTIHTRTNTSAAPHSGLPLSWLLSIPLLWSLTSTYAFSQNWIKTAPEAVEVADVLHELQPEATQWIEPPFGEHYWTPPALAQGLKLTTITRPWHWKDRPKPLPYRRASREAVDSADPGYRNTVQNVLILSYPEHQYAAIDTGDQQVPCQAQALGGNIEVTCTTGVPGELIVQENMWSGWYAQRDGIPIPLATGPWLRVEAPVGTHHYIFRYQPWDVLIGLFLTSLGVLLCLWHWFGRSMQVFQFPSAPEQLAEVAERPQA